MGQEICRVFTENHDLYVLTLLFYNFRYPNEQDGLGEDFTPFSVTWGDAGEAVRLALAAPTESLPSRCEPFFIFADLPHQKFTNEKAKRILGWHPTNNLEEFWRKRPSVTLADRPEPKDSRQEASMTTSISVAAMEQGNTAQQTTGRPVIYGTQGVISSGHYLTSMAGMRMLLSGGNAFDAIVAAGFAAAVTEPIASYSLAAEGVFMLYHAESGALLSLSGQGTAPRLATVDWYRSQGQEEIPTGPGPLAHLSFTVPGVVAAFLSMLERYGTKTVGEVLEPSIHYAERGIPNYEYMLERIDSPGTRSQFDLYPPGGTDVFFEDGKVPAPGSLLIQNGLGAILRKLVEAESAAAGHRVDGVRAARDCFYTGDVAQIIHDCAHGVGGILGLKSLASYEAKYETPIKTSYMGHEIHGTAHVDSGRGADAGTQHPGELRSPGDGSQLHDVHTHRKPGAQPGVRRPRGVLRRP